MKTQLQRFLLPLMILVVVGGLPLLQAQTNAPDGLKVQQGLKLADVRVHDPFIVAHQPTKTYYLYTAGGPRHGLDRSGVITYKSKDLREWEGPFVVFTVPDGIWANPRHGVWAPEVHEYKGRFYLFATLHNNDAILSTPPQVWRTNHLRGSIVAGSDSPEGPFQCTQAKRPASADEFHDSGRHAVR
jgi:beta-xylosidase